MGLVSVRIDSRPYTLTCADGTEDYVKGCAAVLDQKVQTLKGQLGTTVPENMLLCLAGILLVDDLKKSDNRPISQKEAPADLSGLVDTLNLLAEKLENI